MRERDISLEQVSAVLARPEGDPAPGSSPGSMELVASIGAKRLKVVVSAADSTFVISTYWIDEG